jgi:hypothetical protein
MQHARRLNFMIFHVLCTDRKYTYAKVNNQLLLQVISYFKITADTLDKDVSEVKVTKQYIENLLKARDTDNFEKCDALWTSSEHWKEFWCARIYGVVIKTFAICKTWSMVLSVPYGTVQTLNRHQTSHAKVKTNATASGSSGQLKMTSFGRPNVIPEKVFYFIFNCIV